MADFGRELLRRRVPQIVGAYLAGGWILLEFTDWAVNRYVLSAHVTDFVVASWLLLLPAVAILAWNHGSPGRDRWSRADTIGVGLNLVLAGAILFSLFQGQNLGAATSTVIAQDEEGKEVVRQVPLPESRHRIALFSFTNASGDPELDWLQYALPKAIQIDLAQDPFVVALADIWLEKQGSTADQPLVLPLARRKEIAGQVGAEAFVTGSFDRVSEGIELRLTLMDTERGRPVAERIIGAPSALGVVDAASIQLRRDLEVPTGHVEATPDLPVEEMLSANPEALKPFFVGTFYRAIDASRSRTALEQAVESDSTFARAHAILGEMRFGANDLDGALDAFEAAIRHEYRLEEATRFALKTQYFYAGRQPDRALSVARLRTELYPHDPEAFAMLARLLRVQGDTEGSLEAYSRTIELDPTNRQALLARGDLLRDDGLFEPAEASYRALQALDPTDAVPHLRLADLALVRGRFAAARAEYERARILDPSRILPVLGLASVATISGQFEEAERHLDDAEVEADSESERLQVLDARQRYLDFRGRPGEAAGFARQVAAMRGRSGGRLEELQSLGHVAVLRARAGDEAAAARILDTLRAELRPPLDGLVDLFDAQVHRETGSAEGLTAGIEGLESLIASFGLGGSDWLGEMLEAEALRMAGDCEAAVPRYREAGEGMQETALFYTIREFGVDPVTAEASCLRELGRIDEARDRLQGVQARLPAEPTVLLERARIESAAARPDAAREAVDEALLAWSEAEPGYRPAAEARELRGRLYD
ncbi:MAG: tetratricopeptide repeat protein [marine benthic group bacterium]|nr:tetratricopeptide repeat protein [Gemmatimonadota bacterium]MCL7980735.1 tetratricopeptide repeat protein [Gemmatimonadota bacterium]